MVKGSDWHLYPSVDAEKCVNCGACDLACPYQNEQTSLQSESEFPYSFAAYNKDFNVRMQSTSGGVFSALANHVLQEGGCVCAARFDEDAHWKVIHDFAYTTEELVPFRKSKYVQSDVGLAYRQIKKLLREGQNVLFVGLPCQVAGLKHFLHHDYDNLLTLDLICMGIASPFIWAEYLHAFEPEHIKQITFKDKSIGWYHTDWRMIFEYGNNLRKVSKGRENHYMFGYLDRMYYRPSCYSCLFKQRNSYSDITIGDAWGLEHITPEFIDNKGTSVIIVNTLKGDKVIKSIRNVLETTAFPYEAVKYNNKYLRRPVLPSKSHDAFYRLLNEKGLYTAMKKYCEPHFNWIAQLRRIIKR